jgi:hypothetical protein
MNPDKYFDLRSCHSKKTQVHIIADIFENKPNQIISSTDLNNEYSLRHLLNQCIKKGMDDNSINEFKKIINFTTMNKISLPGDVQRQPRTFLSKHKNHGLERFEKEIKENENENKNKKKKKKKKKKGVFFKYTPILLNNIKDDKMAARTFSNELMLKKCDKCKNKCEMCMKKNVKLYGDHWRPHSVYNDTRDSNCVMLCIECNNAKGNKNGSGIDIVRKWFKEKGKWQTLYKNFLKIEKRINKAGLEPNNKDKASINEILVKLGYPEFY